MPYGIAKEHGGDSLENVTKMESCVKQVMAQERDKSSAIAICKSRIFTQKRKRKRR